MMPFKHLLLLSAVLLHHTSSVALPDPTCSYAEIDGKRYEPLQTCVPMDDISSLQVSCDEEGSIQMSKWLSSPICQGKPTPIDVKTMSITAWQCECPSFDVAQSAAALLPNPVDPVPIISTSPSASPTAPAPTKSPITDHPTAMGQTQSPSQAYVSTPIHVIDTTENMHHETTNDAPFERSTMKPFASPSIPIHALCLLVTLSLFCASIYHLWIKQPDPNKRPIVWTVKLLVLLTFMSNLVGIACIMVVSIMISTTGWTQHTYNLALIPYYGISVAYSFGKFNLECFFLFRVYTAFRNSTYALSQPLCALLICCMFVVSFLWCFMFVGYVNNGAMPYYAYILVSVLEMWLIFVLLYLFLKRLSGLILRHKLYPKMPRHSTESQVSSKVSVNISSKPSTAMPDSTTLANHPSSTINTPRTHVPMPSSTPVSAAFTPKPSISGSSHVSTVSVAEEEASTSVKSFQSSLSVKQTKWIFLMTRCILLSSVSLVTTIGFGFFAFYWSQFNTVHIFIVYALWSIDMTTNSVCLYLNFIFANGLYTGACNVCHRLCQRLVERAAAKQMLNRYLNDVKNMQDTSANI